VPDRENFFLTSGKGLALPKNLCAGQVAGVFTLFYSCFFAPLTVFFCLGKKTGLTLLNCVDAPYFFIEPLLFV
jgi:hypothetical protein